MHPRLRINVVFVGMLVSSWLIGSDQLPAQERRDDQERAEAALQLTKSHAEKYALFPPTESPACKLVPQPILRWSNPERGQIFGNVFLWTYDGRPFAVGSLYKWYSPFTHMSHEFHSLSPNGLRGTYEDKAVWKTDQPGLAFQDLPDAPEVAPTPAARLIQMRQLARRFTASSADAEGKSTELRLLSQPVYRYESASAPTPTSHEDGGLFTFVQGTDPEVWLLLEATPAGKSSRWQYGLVRMNSILLTVEYQGTEVWRVPVISGREVGSHQGPYTRYHFEGPKP